MARRGRAELAIADTSVFIALERKRKMAGTPPQRVAVSVVTVGELRLGVLSQPTDRHARGVSNRLASGSTRAATN